MLKLRYLSWKKIGSLLSNLQEQKTSLKKYPYKLNIPQSLTNLWIQMKYH